MSVMDRFARLDSALQRGLDNTFARVFGGRVVPPEIEELLKQEARDNLVATEDDRLAAPNVYMVGVSSKDLLNLAEGNPQLPVSFADQMSRYCRNQAWTLSGPVVVHIAEESGLRTGQLRVSSYIDPSPVDQSGFEAINPEDLQNNRTGRTGTPGIPGIPRPRTATATAPRTAGPGTEPRTRRGLRAPPRTGSGSRRDHPSFPGHRLPGGEHERQVPRGRRPAVDGESAAAGRFQPDLPGP